MKKNENIGQTGEAAGGPAPPGGNLVNPEAPAESGASSDVETWASKINQASGCTSGWAVKTGDLLRQAQTELPRGHWTKLFQGERLKFGLRTAQMLMKISQHPVLRRAKYFSFLPASWSVLHELSKLPGQALEQGITQGVIDPELCLASARAMVRDVRAAGQPLTVKSFDLPTHSARLQAYLRRQARRWPVDHRAELASLLEAMALELRNQ